MGKVLTMKVLMRKVLIFKKTYKPKIGLKGVLMADALLQM